MKPRRPPPRPPTLWGWRCGRCGTKGWSPRRAVPKCAGGIAYPDGSVVMCADIKWPPGETAPIVWTTARKTAGKPAARPEPPPRPVIVPEPEPVPAIPGPDMATEPERARNGPEHAAGTIGEWETTPPRPTATTPMGTRLPRRPRMGQRPTDPRRFPNRRRDRTRPL